MPLLCSAASERRIGPLLHGSGADWRLLMYAVVGTAKLDANRRDEAVAVAKGILANVSQAAGFVSGVFTRSTDGTAGRSMIVFESEEAARAVAEKAQSMIPEGGPTEIVSLEIFEVVDRV